jgi:Tol biopolymer transport system component
VLRKIVTVSVLSASLVVAGATVASAAPTNGRIVYVKYGPGHAVRVMSVQPDGSGRLRVYEAGGFWSTGYRMALSPDGARILLAQSHQSSDGSVYLSRLVSVDATNGGHLVVVFHAQDSFYSSIAWFPDGSGLLFSRALFGDAGDGHYRLYSSLPDGSDVVQVGTGPLFDAAMSPDLTRIAYVDGKERLGVMDADGGNPSLLVTDGRNFGPQWSPDGSTLVFTRYAAGSKNYHLSTIAPDGSGLTELFGSKRRGEGDPAWSPDGTRIVFLRSAYHRTSTDLFTVGADGSNLRRVTQDWAHENAPQWGPA